MKLLDKVTYAYIDINVVNPIKNKDLYFSDFVYRYEKLSRSGLLYFIRSKDNNILNYISEYNPLEILYYLENRLKIRSYYSKFNRHIDCILFNLLLEKYPEYLSEYRKFKDNKSKVCATNPSEITRNESLTWSDSDTTNINNKINELRNNIGFWDV